VSEEKGVGNVPLGQPVMRIVIASLRRPSSSMIASTLVMSSGRYRSDSAIDNPHLQ
jgi:hypothetical protein